MGHSIQFYTYKENEDKEKIQAIADDEARWDGVTGPGLNSEIRFIDEVYQNEDDAMKAIEELDKGLHSQLAVKFVQHENAEDTKALLIDENNKKEIMWLVKTEYHV